MHYQEFECGFGLCEKGSSRHRGQSIGSQGSLQQAPDDEQNHPKSTKNDFRPSVEPTSHIDPNILPLTLLIANQLDHTHQASWRERLGQLPDARGASWQYIQSHLEATFDLRLPPNPRIAWVTAQAAMGLKGMRLAFRKMICPSYPDDSVILGRMDCGLALNYNDAKSSNFITGLACTSAWEEPQEELAEHFRDIIHQLYIQVQVQNDL
ncbi:hypothetical protein PG999_013881 [Apiospora kogelbergensis]|uniref:Choline/carnitine acyltransferase domain-containing protein n=1 Tax=Apiospora kogelbergensis TaxID=1337665 RepID=A0AAW0Q5T0_9PEZI